MFSLGSSAEAQFSMDFYFYGSTFYYFTFIFYQSINQSKENIIKLHIDFYQFLSGAQFSHNINFLKARNSGNTHLREKNCEKFFL